MGKRSWQAGTIDGHFVLAPHIDNEDILQGDSDIYLYDENGNIFGLLYANLEKRDALDESILDGQKEKAKMIVAVPKLIAAVKEIIHRFDNYDSPLTQTWICSDSLHPTDDDKTIVDYLKDVIAETK